MKVKEIQNREGTRRLSIRSKLTLSLSAIAVILLVSSVISILEYSRMSTYVSGLIADNIESVNEARNLSQSANRYNLEILTAVGDETSGVLPEFDKEAFIQSCKHLKMSFGEERLTTLADSVMYSYSAYMLASMELEDVLQSDFIDSRSWYFERLQPMFRRLSSDINAMSDGIYNDLRKNSETFQRGFYRSIIPGVVAVGVGLLLVLLLLFFMMVYYVNPLYRMLDGLKSYNENNKNYNCSFDGDDQLSELNEGISDIINENQMLRRRIVSYANTDSEN